MRFAYLIILLMLAGCGSIASHPAPGTELPDALRTWGTTTVIEQKGSIDVVIIADRHSIGAGIGYVSEGHRAQQMEQARAIEWLVNHGYTILGSEFELGPIPTDGAAAEHRTSIESAIEEGDDLNRWSHFQPVRYAVTLAPRLAVWGVEDPVLYAADVKDLDAILDIRDFRKHREGQSTPTDSELDRKEAALKARIRSHVDQRGRAAARNLLELANARGATRVILMLGAAHCGAAAGECAASGAAVTLFTPKSLRK